MDRRAQPFHVPVDVRPAPAAVRLVEEEIELRPERVDLQFVVREAVAVGVDEDLEIVLPVDDGVAVGQRGPQVRLFQPRSHVQRPFIPDHLDARVEGRIGPALAANVDEGGHPRGGAPCFILQHAVDQGRGSRRRRLVFPGGRQIPGCHLRQIPGCDRGERRQGQYRGRDHRESHGAASVAGGEDPEGAADRRRLDREIPFRVQDPHIHPIPALEGEGREPQRLLE